MKKILTFATTFPKFTTWDATPGFVYDLSKRLQKLWLQIIVLTPRVPWSKKYEEKDWMKIYRYSYFLNNKWEKLNDWAILPNLKQNKLLFFQVPFLLLLWFINLVKLVKKEKIDTIHAHWIIPQGFLAVLYKKIFNKNIKIVCTTHGWDIFWLRWKIGTLVKKYTLKNINKLTVVSNAIKKECINLWIKENKIDVIPMWVDTKLFTPDNYDESIKQKYNITSKFLLFVWRLAEKKWVKYLIEAMVDIVWKYPDTKLLIIWYWPLENELKEQSKRVRLEENIIFTWAIQNSDLPAYYATADIFIWPSIIATDWDREGLPVTYMEAMSSWCMLLGTNLEWNKDIIQEWINWNYILQNSSSDIVKKIEYIFHNNIKREDIRKTIIELFSWKIISEKYFNIIIK